MQQAIEYDIKYLQLIQNLQQKQKNDFQLMLDEAIKIPKSHIEIR